MMANGIKKTQTSGNLVVDFFDEDNFTNVDEKVEYYQMESF